MAESRKQKRQKRQAYPAGERRKDSMSEELMMSAAGEERSITTITDEIIFYKSVGGQAVIEIGKRLMEAKAQLTIMEI